jgi:hypothetical protein
MKNLGAMMLFWDKFNYDLYIRILEIKYEKR